MARTEDKEKAIALRKQGMSYSQIKTELGISKGTLSDWLRNMPLSRKRINELRANSEIRIEKYRITMQKKKDTRREGVYKQVAQDLSSSTDVRLVSGFYLYWGEGTKSAEYSTSLTNSDPSVIRYFISWLEYLGVSRSSLKVKLHTYTDQDEVQMRKFWSRTLGIPLSNFNKTYIKKLLQVQKRTKGCFHMERVLFPITTEICTSMLWLGFITYVTCIQNNLSIHLDSNQGQFVYKTNALPTELWMDWGYPQLYRELGTCSIVSFRMRCIS